MTRIIIAHRSQTIASADRVVAFQRGAIVPLPAATALYYDTVSSGIRNAATQQIFRQRLVNAFTATPR
jgi:ABC-type bacteriocin/lantibiotic exporter with double-glycine peptidase domain